MKLPQNVQTAIRLLENSGYEVYVVGGAVRDYLLGKTPSDYDLSSNATPKEVKQVFKDYFIVETGIKHGTISVMINNKFLEITTYRYEESYTDSRRPDKVYFIRDIKEDLARRDFTINAICYNKNYLDLFSGREDLNSKIIRAIGEPLKRFTEDPLRILRALRFASVLEFEIEEKTKEALISNFSLLELVSKERINNEFSKLLIGVNFEKVMLEYKTLLEKHVLKFEVKEVSIKATSLLEEDLNLRLACLLIDLNVDKANKCLTELKFPKKIIKEVVKIIDNYSLKLVADEISLLKILKKLDYELLGKIIKLKKAYAFINKQDLSELEKIKICYTKLNYKYLKVSNLKINGKDLINLGFKEGIEIREVLDKLLNDCINGLDNNKEELIKRAKEYLYK